MCRVCKQLTPWQRRLDGLIICDAVYDLIGIAIPSMIGSFLPKPGTVQIWLSNAKQRKRSNSQGKFEDEKAQYNLWCTPLPWDGGEAGRKPHDVGGDVLQDFLA